MPSSHAPQPRQGPPPSGRTIEEPRAGSVPSAPWITPRPAPKRSANRQAAFEQALYQDEQSWVGPVEEVPYHAQGHPHDGPYGGDDYSGGCDECGSEYGGYTHDCDTCGNYAPPCGGCGHCAICLTWRWWHDLGVFGGTHAFKGPVDNGTNGNFGLHYGFNWGAPLWAAAGIGVQLGFQIQHSDFSGDQALSPTLRTDGREQYFITTGLFHRPMAPGWLGLGWQSGLVVDWLRDKYYAEMSMSQIRMEISAIGPFRDEVGFWCALSTGSDEDFVEITPNLTITETWEPIDQFNFFYRRRFSNVAEGRLWGGFTGESDGLFGGDMRIVVNGRTAIVAGFNYLKPSQGRYEGGQLEEAWGINLNVEVSPGWFSPRTQRSPTRPLFNVGDNSTFMVQSM